MEQRELVAVVITADGKRVPVRLPDDDPAVSVLARVADAVRRLLGLEPRS